MNSYAPTLSGVVGRLNEARLRLLAQGVMNAALWAVTAGLAIFAVLEAARRLGGPGTLGVQVPPAVTTAALSTVVVFAAGIAIAILRLPPIDALARRADQAFGLRERISTALEVDRTRSGERSAVVAAMIADALRHSSVVNPARLVGFRLPRSAVLVPVAAIAAAAVLLLAPVQPVAIGDLGAPDTSTTLDAAQRASAAEDIHRVAEAIGEEAASNGDATMQAVANTLGELSERVAMSPEVTREDVLKELGSLLGSATAAGSQWRGTKGERIPEVIEALEESIAQPRMAEPMPTQDGEPLPDESDDPSVDPTIVGSPTAPESLETVLQDLERRNGYAQAGDPNRAGAKEELLDYIKAAPAQAAPQVQANPQETSDNAQMFGAQADAGAAENTLAGEGTEAIGDEPIAQLVDLKTTTEMTLTGEDSGEGRRLQIEITPDTKLTEITEQSLAADTDAWQRSAEAETARDAIGIDDRDTVSRYLRALLGPAEK